jgi:hypothetical protein
LYSAKSSLTPRTSIRQLAVRARKLSAPLTTGWDRGEAGLIFQL